MGVEEFIGQILQKHNRIGLIFVSCLCSLMVSICENAKSPVTFTSDEILAFFSDAFSGLGEEKLRSDLFNFIPMYLSVFDYEGSYDENAKGAETALTVGETPHCEGQLIEFHKNLKKTLGDSFIQNPNNFNEFNTNSNPLPTLRAHPSQNYITNHCYLMKNLFSSIISQFMKDFGHSFTLLQFPAPAILDQHKVVQIGWFEDNIKQTSKFAVVCGPFFHKNSQISSSVEEKTCVSWYPVLIDPQRLKNVILYTAPLFLDTKFPKLCFWGDGKISLSQENDSNEGFVPKNQFVLDEILKMCEHIQFPTLESARSFNNLIKEMWKNDFFSLFRAIPKWGSTLSALEKDFITLANNFSSQNKKIKYLEILSIVFGREFEQIKKFFMENNTKSHAEHEPARKRRKVILSETESPDTSSPIAWENCEKIDCLVEYLSLFHMIDVSPSNPQNSSPDLFLNSPKKSIETIQYCISNSDQSTDTLAELRINCMFPLVEDSGLQYFFKIDDLSFGREKEPLVAINSFDLEPLEFFRYHNYEDNHQEMQKLGLLDFSAGCECKNMCKFLFETDNNPSLPEELCTCCENDKFPYTVEKRLADSFNRQEYITECNSHCSCYSHKQSCPNRLVQFGSDIFFMVSKTPNGRGWGLKIHPKEFVGAKDVIKRGTFLCCYLGELITEEEAEARGLTAERAGDYISYIFDLAKTNKIAPKPKRRKRTSGSDTEEDENVFSVDAKILGNVARFINHSCDPNVEAVSVLVEVSDHRCPLLALFAKKDIAVDEELCLDYKYKKNKMVKCLCGSPNCCGWLR